MADEQNPSKPGRDTVLPERLMRRVLEGVGDVVDRKLGRTIDPKSGLTTDQLVQRMNALIDQRVRNDKTRGRIAPHHLKLKVEWGKHSETPPEITRRLETEMLAAAIDHINDSRYRTLAPVPSCRRSGNLKRSCGRKICSVSWVPTATSRIPRPHSAAFP